MTLFANQKLSLEYNQVDICPNFFTLQIRNQQTVGCKYWIVQSNEKKNTLNVKKAYIEYQYDCRYKWVLGFPVMTTRIRQQSGLLLTKG